MVEKTSTTCIFSLWFALYPRLEFTRGGIGNFWHGKELIEAAIYPNMFVMQL
jgi:lysophospholipid acyltransferase (LPLAT)-like uncharacterized protein